MSKSDEEDDRVYALSQSPTDLALLRAKIEIQEAHLPDHEPAEETDADGLSLTEARICASLGCDPATFLRLKYGTDDKRGTR